MAADAAVSNDVQLKDEMVVLSGPNMGGKSTFLRSLMAVALLANCGLPVPAAPGATVPEVCFVLVTVSRDMLLLLLLPFSWRRFAGALPDPTVIALLHGSHVDHMRRQCGHVPLKAKPWCAVQQLHVPQLSWRLASRAAIRLCVGSKGDAHCPVARRAACNGRQGR
jgi:MutS domain V